MMIIRMVLGSNDCSYSLVTTIPIEHGCLFLTSRGSFQERNHGFVARHKQPIDHHHVLIDPILDNIDHLITSD